MKEIKLDNVEVEYLKNLIEDVGKNEEHTVLSQKIVGGIARKLKNASKPPIKPASRKAKGRALQYYVCERIAKVFGIEYRQSDDNCEIHSREMGQHGTDVILRGRVGETFPFSVECKNCETILLPQWLSQCRTNTAYGKYPLLVVKNKKIGVEPVVVIEWGAFEHLMEIYVNGWSFFQKNT